MMNSSESIVFLVHHSTMSYRCLCCLSQNNLRGLGIKEWYICSYILHPYITKDQNIKNNKMARLCSNCHQSFLHIDKFRNQAIQSYLNLIALWNKELKQKETLADPLKLSEMAITTNMTQVFTKVQFDHDDHNKNTNKLDHKETDSEETKKPKVKTEIESINECVGNVDDNKSLTPKTENKEAEEEDDNDDYDKEILLPKTEIGDEESSETEIATEGGSDKDERVKSKGTFKVPAARKKDKVTNYDPRCSKNLKEDSNVPMKFMPTPPPIMPGMPGYGYGQYPPKRDGHLYVCKHCDKKYKHYDSLEQHYQIIHQGLPRVICTICNKTLKHKFALKRHIRLNHSGEKIFCETCDKPILKRAWKVHLKMSKKHNMEKAQEKKKPCPICNKSIFNMSNHMTTHNDVVYCRPCNKVLSKYSYKHHLETSSKHIETRNLRFSCDYCGARFMAKRNVAYHILTVHLKERGLHKCELCPKSYASTSGLKIHVAKFHHKIPPTKNYFCEVCGVGFETNTILRQHMVTHTKERPYKCELCGDTFGFSGALYTHRKLKHNYKKRNDRTTE